MLLQISLLMLLIHQASSANITCRGGEKKISIIASTRNHDTVLSHDCDVTMVQSCKLLTNSSSGASLFDSCTIDRGYICNRTIECSGVDLCAVGCPGYYKCINDECVFGGCSDGSMNPGVGFRCSVNGVETRISRFHILDDIRDCDDDEDYCYSVDALTSSSSCSNGPLLGTLNTTRCFECFDGSTLIPRNRVCNNFFDCPDLSDECLCQYGEIPSVCNDVVEAVSLVNLKVSGCPVGQIECGDDVCIRRDRVCDGIGDCPDDRDERFCSKSLQVQNSVRTSPYDVNSSSVSPSEASNLTSATFRPSVPGFTCMSLNRTEIMIAHDRVCDLECDCDDCLDELNCNDTRFYCESGRPIFVTHMKVFDSRGDCSDWSDECPSAVPENKTQDAFSTSKDIIGIPILRGLVWIMAIAAVFGNGLVIVHETKRIRSLFRGSLHGSLRANHLLILNLAIADLLMGVYLVFLGVVESLYRGVFCQNQMTWCSGGTCQIMGSLVVLSSETSVVTMVILTSFRLLSVYKPIASRERPKTWTIISLIMMSWAISFSLALVPLLPKLENLFATSSYIPGIPFFRSDVVKFNEAKDWAVKALTYDPSFGPSDYAEQIFRINNATSWNEIKESLGTPKIANYLTPVGLFGYYSAHSVCIPRLFVTREQDSWKYSFSLMVINLLAFIYVAAAYVVIIIKAKKKTIRRNSKVIRGRSRKGSRNLVGGMHRKVFRLILTDFCCWVPISIMAVINFAGIPVPDLAYVISAIVLLPINSALNPIIYSDLIGKLKSHVSSYKSFSSSSSSSTNLSRHGKTQKLPESPELRSKTNS